MGTFHGTTVASFPLYDALRFQKLALARITNRLLVERVPDAKTDMQELRVSTERDTAQRFQKLILERRETRQRCRIENARHAHIAAVPTHRPSV